MARPGRRSVSIPPLEERLGRLEVSVENLHADFERVGDALQALESGITRGKETNWSVVIAGVLLVVSLYAAAISPLKADIDRQATVDAAHEARDQKAHDEQDLVKDRQIDVMSRLKALEQIDEELRNTVPSLDRRVALLELKFGLPGTGK